MTSGRGPHGEQMQPPVRPFGSRLLNRVAGALSGRGGVLAYHGVVPGSRAIAGLHATLPAICAQLDALRDAGYHFIALPEMLGRLRTGRSVARCLTITFDDAYSGIDFVLPELRARRIPATVFVPTGSVECGRGFWWDRLERIAHALTADEFATLARSLCGLAVPPGREAEYIRALIVARDAGRLTPETERAFAARESSVAPLSAMACADWTTLTRWSQWEGFTFAPHSVSHPVLPLLSADEQRSEIARSFATLADRLPRVLPVVAYPYGLYSASTLRAAREARMTGGVTMDRFGCTPGETTAFAVPRLPYGGTSSVKRMPLYLSTPWRRYRRRDWADGFPRIPARPDAAAVAAPPGAAVRRSAPGG